MNPTRNAQGLCRGVQDGLLGVLRVVTRERGKARARGWGVVDVALDLLDDEEVLSRNLPA